MLLTQATKNAITLLRELHDEPVTVKFVSEKHAIPYDFLQQISLKLRRAGLSRSVRGPGGGIVRAHTEITLHEVDRVMSNHKRGRSCPLENLIEKKFHEINVLA